MPPADPDALPGPGAVRHARRPDEPGLDAGPQQRGADTGAARRSQAGRLRDDARPGVDARRERAAAARCADPRDRERFVAAPDAARGVSNGRGAAILPAHRLPAEYTVVASGGRSDDRRFAGELRAEARRTDRIEVVHANPATTLVAALRGRHPGMSVRRTHERVRTFLELPRTLDLGADVKATDRWFSGARLVRHAEARGGLDRYVAEVAGRIGRHPGARRAFRPGAGAPLAQAAAAFDYQGLLTAMADDAGGSTAAFGVGSLLSALWGGGGNGVAAAPAKIDKDLVEIKAELGALRSQITAMESDTLNALLADFTQRQLGLEGLRQHRELAAR